ncbi:MAG: DUF2442 domain-containing protein [Prevotellaceae bacterium]|jgi:hypothetical protein|nr:DUF2442 domain-containing protein [Prevotellaceae bacterium]
MSVKVEKVWIDQTAVHIQTSDGKVFSEKINDYPRLRYATKKQREAFTYNNIGIRWEELDEDLSFEGFMHKKDCEKPALYHLFKSHPELNVSGIARNLGIPQSVMAAYLCGIKKPSQKRLHEIESAIHEIGENLCSVRL